MISFLKKLISASMITNVSERQFDTDASVKRPGIVGHIVQDGEDLWSLAKKIYDDGIRYYGS